MSILTDAAEIAFPRYPGSEGDRRATEIVRSKMLDAGLVLAATALASRLPIVALSLLGVGALSGGLLLVWAPGAERLYSRAGPTKTSNVTGYRRVARPRLSLILLAHHDSKSQNLTFPVRMGLTLLSLLGGAGLAGMLLAAVARGRPVEPEWTTIVAGIATAAASRLGIGVRGIVMLPAMGIDAIPFAHRGVPCLTLSSGSLDRATISVHSANDVADHLDEPTLERVARLSREVVAELERRYAAALSSPPASGA